MKCDKINMYWLAEIFEVKKLGEFILFLEFLGGPSQ